MLSFVHLLAQEQQPPQGSLTSLLLMFGMMFAIFYFLVIRPQKKKEMERQAMLSRLKKNDRVVTQGGMYGVVARVQDDDVVLKIDLDQNVRVKFARSAIAGILGEKSDDEKA